MDLSLRRRDTRSTAAAWDTARVQAPRNVADLVRRSAAEHPDRTALIWQDQTVAWRELDAAIDAYAYGLQQELQEAGQRVAISLPNRPEFAIAYFAALRAGLTAVPINPAYTARELDQILDDSGASVLIATPDVLETATKPPPRTYHVGNEGGARPFADLDHRGRTPDERIARTAVLLYTSGTEGRPKGAMLSHGALIANHEQLGRINPPPVGGDDTVLLAVPMFHAYGLNAGLGAIAYHGATGLLVDTFEPVESLRLIQANHVSAIIGVPTMFVAWSLLPDFGEAFAGVRMAVCGAAPLPAEAATRFLEITSHPIFIGYGLTETSPVLTTTLASPAPKPGSIGRAIPGVEVKLVGADGAEIWNSAGGPTDDDDDDDADPGQIVVRGANLFDGYWPDGHGGPDADGWWRTGDVAYADADGELFLVDRVRELILVNGFNVYPAEVEQVLASHASVKEAAVLGVPHPYTGQSVKAYVVPRQQVGADELVRHCERNLARFKCPSAIEFVTSLPHSAIGKVRKGELRDV
jgi:long-chain acyl-CoA synthetase